MPISLRDGDNSRYHSINRSANKQCARGFVSKVSKIKQSDLFEVVESIAHTRLGNDKLRLGRVKLDLLPQIADIYPQKV
jgi:hypothetical protein